MKRVIIALAISVLMAGCITIRHGTYVGEQQAEQFKVGQATLEQVKAALGAPTSEGVDSSGTRWLTYSYANVRGTVTGSTGETRVTTFIFGPDGKLQSFRSSGSSRH
jgi:outer membrane protein assembly factor BamE (lipoprotein component of BamABCDE complex)